jgi:hypothetical protein
MKSIESQHLIDWLLEGDVSIQYQVHRDLLGKERPDLQERIAKEGWGTQFLNLQLANGHWGNKFYHPKWTSSNYTLLDLKNLNISPDIPAIRDTIAIILRENNAPDGGIMPIGTIKASDMCINGMVLECACYFGLPQEDLKSIVDLTIELHMPDGGFNCRVNRSGAVHSSMHTTINVLEGLLEYEQSGYKYRLDDVQEAANSAEEFLLMHRLFKSDNTGEVIDKKWLMLSYPPRWKYDILRALDYFQAAGVDYDPSMQDALDVLVKKQRKDGTWPVQAKHPGLTHFEMEKTGGPSRWNTLRALRVLKKYGERR